MLDLYNILQKKTSYKVNPNFEKSNHVVQHHYVRVFFFCKIFYKPSISQIKINK